MDLSDTAVIQFRGEQVDRLYSHALSDSVLGVIAALAAAAISYGPVPAGAIAIWALIAVTLYAVRLILAATYKKLSVSSSGLLRWLRYFVAGAILTGIVWGVLASYIAHSTDLLRAGIVIFIAGIATLISVATSTGSVPAAAGFSVCALAPPAFVLLARGDSFGYTIACMLVLFVALIITGSHLMKRLLWEAVALKTETRQLTGHLDQRRTQVEKLNVALKTNQDKREQAEQNLRRTAADLGLVQGKARVLAETLERVSPVCQVTALPNRRAFDNHVDSEWRRATRDQRPLSLVVMGLDEYDEYLTSHGRQSTDILLKRIGQTVKGFGRRAGDLAGRYDESRFGLALQNCDARNAMRIAEALRKRIEAHKIPHTGGRGSRQIMTIHAGVATMTPARSLQSGQLFKRVETAVYEAQFQGGNKVVMYKPLSKLRLERWDTPNDGQLNEQALLQKLLVWGYDTEKTLLPPGTSLPGKAADKERVISILTGELKITVEGHAMVIKPGDSIFVPAAMVVQLDAVSERPVMQFTATKSE